MTESDIFRMAEAAGIKNDCDGVWCSADELIAFAHQMMQTLRDRIGRRRYVCDDCMRRTRAAGYERG